MAPPKKYEPGFLAKMDGRTEVAKILKDRFEEITDDLGGTVAVSRIKLTLVERFIWLESRLVGMELEMAQGDAQKAKEMMGKWVYGVNALVGLAKVLGIERISKAENLQTYLTKSNGETV
ncbi:MAG: hypothetical protein ACYTG0_10950 [Planctomycetota bacterium]|jgi:hypothetical protein